MNLAEIALIVGLAKYPSEGNVPFQNPAKVNLRKEYVLNQMVEQRYITQAEADEAKRTVLQIYEADADFKIFNTK